MKFRRPSILVQLIAAIGLGAAFGCAAPAWGIRLTNCFRDQFGEFIRFFVPFIILGLVTPAIAETGRGAGRKLLLTLALAYASTLLAGVFAFGVSETVFPHLLAGTAKVSDRAVEFPAYFRLAIPPVLGVTSALATAFAVGLGMASTGATALERLASEFRGVVVKILEKVLVPLLPAYVMTVLADIAASGRLSAVGGASVRIMAVGMAATVSVLVLQYLVAGLIARRNPLKALVTMFPAYLTGWGCCSSAATIPYTLRQTKLNGVSDETADLVIPLCANVHLAGSMTNMVVYAAGMMVLAGETLGFGAFAQYILMISVIAVASPGVPGGVVLASASVAEVALGFTPERYALMAALYMALDGMGTACNLTGDGAIAMIVDRLSPRHET